MAAIPERIPCYCGDLSGVLHLKKAVIEFVDSNGLARKVQPSEFEHLSGRGSAKKWKASIKVGSGVPNFEGKDIGVYLRDKLGVDIQRGVYQPSISSKPPHSSKNDRTLSRSAVQSKSCKEERVKDFEEEASVAKKQGNKPSKHALSKASTSVVDVNSFQVIKQKNALSDGRMQKSSGKAERDPITTMTGTKRSLAERIQEHFRTHSMCYEPPRSTGASLDANATLMVRAQAHGQWSPHGESDYFEEVHISHGRPRKLSRCIVDINNMSTQQLLRMCANTGKSGDIMKNFLLEEVPSVPSNKVSGIPLDRKKGQALKKTL